MSRKRLISVLWIEAVLCLAFVIIGNGFHITYDKIITFPFVQVAYLLRWFSLSSMLGNIFAIVNFLLIGGIPLIIAGIKFKRGQWIKADSLLFLLSAMIFITLYYCINPTYIAGEFTSFGSSSFGPLMFTSVFYIILSGYIALYLLNRFEHSGTHHLLKYLSWILTIAAIVLVIVICGFIPWQMNMEMDLLRVGNTDPTITFGMSDTFIILRLLVEVLPLIFQTWIIIKGLRLIDALKIERYSDEVTLAAKAMEKICRLAIVITTIAAISLNVSQLLFSKYILVSNYQLQIPITSFIIMLITMILSRYFIESREIKKEIDMFV